MSFTISDRVIRSSALTIEVTEWFEDPDFQRWLVSSEPKHTTWQPGQPISDDTEVMLLVCPSLNGNGTGDVGSLFPQKYWDQLVTICRDMGLYGECTHIHVRLKCCDLDETKLIAASQSNLIGEALAIVRQHAVAGMDELSQDMVNGDCSEEACARAMRNFEAAWSVVAAAAGVQPVEVH